MAILPVSQPCNATLTHHCFYYWHGLLCFCYMQSIGFMHNAKFRLPSRLATFYPTSHTFGATIIAKVERMISSNMRKLQVLLQRLSIVAWTLRIQDTTLNCVTKKHNRKQTQIKYKLTKINAETDRSMSTMDRFGKMWYGDLIKQFKTRDYCNKAMRRTPPKRGAILNFPCIDSRGRMSIMIMLRSLRLEIKKKTER